MILIVSFQDNDHVRSVTKHLRSDYMVVDMSWFPRHMCLSAYTGSAMDELFLTAPDNRRLALNEVGAVWYRRIRPLGLDSGLTDETAQLFAWSESTEAILGVWYSMDCFWMNAPIADEVALRKIYQLRVARRSGLSVPETLVTNSPDEARAFVEKHGVGNVIRKAFRNIPQAPRETTLVGPAEMALMDTVKYAPVIFQSFVPAELDLRVTVVDNDIFATAIASDEYHTVDYRSGIETATFRPYTLPDQVADNLLALMDQMNLRFGAIDFRVTSGGEHVFLEVNPAGEFLFVSERTGQPIPAAIAAALDRNASPA